MKRLRKKSLCYLLITIIVFACCGCRNYYKTDSITLAENFTENTAVLPDEIVQYMVSLWGDLNWKRGYTKTAYDFTFKLESGEQLRYVSNLGLFQDYDNDRRAYVSEEQRIYINTMIDEQLTQEYASTTIQLQCESTKEIVNLTEEQVTELLLLWNDCRAERDFLILQDYDYVFELESGIQFLYVSETGMFKENTRRFTVSEEQRQQINAWIEQQVAI